MHIQIQIMFTLGGQNLALNLLLLLFSLGSPAFGNLLWNKIARSMFQNCVHRWELQRLKLCRLCHFVNQCACNIVFFSSYFTLHILYGSFLAILPYIRQELHQSNILTTLWCREDGPYTCTCANLADESKD